MEIIKKFFEENKNIHEFLLKYKSQIIISIFVILMIFVGFINKHSDSSKNEEYTYFDSHSVVQSNELSENSDDTYFVEITGQIVFPGVYELNKEYMIIELLNLAGGATDKADLEYIHKTLGLSTIVQKEQKVFIPAISSGSKLLVNSSRDSKISINQATLTELKTLTGIGEVTAKSIIENRPYDVLEDLMNVTGIGNATYDKIVSQIML